MDYAGKICPYCKTEFKEGDEVVVCSVCEMPHHKECWIENKACTTFGCTGTIVGAEQYAEEMQSDSYCPKCGGVVNDTQKFCRFCGAPVNSAGGPHYKVAEDNNNQNYQQQNNAYNAQGINYNTYVQEFPMDEDMNAFIQTNQQVYAKKFRNLQNSNSIASWNWCSFLLGGLWFAYRKMYGIAVACGVVTFILQFIPTIGRILGLAVYVCSGIFGNFIYKQFVDKELQNSKCMDQYSKSAYIAKKGGTNVPAVIIYIVVNVVINLIIRLISGTF